MKEENKRIAVNTIIIYFRMMLIAIIGFMTTRYVLLSLGVSDFGLFNVVGGVVSMMSFISIAMITTTRRYVNIEMGKSSSNINKIFNVCLTIHISFAILIYVIAITIGLWYINNLLNVPSGKLCDARFVFFISTTVSALGITNVPFQALMAAFERFRQIATIDIFTASLKIPLVVALLMHVGNNLRFYASGICFITLCSLFIYVFYCRCKFRDVVKWRFQRDFSLYKEILVFNNYTSLGAFSYLSRFQGSTMVINYFYGTLVNASYAIALQLESQILNLVDNLSTAANPQITQSYGASNFHRSFLLTCKVSKYSAIAMLIVCFSLYIELEALLGIWLKSIPNEAILFCQAMLLSLFARSLCAGVDALIQATGKVKWYQIIQSILLISGIPLAIIFFISGFGPVYIVISFIICTILRTIAVFIIICRISVFSFSHYVYEVYLPVAKIIVIFAIYKLFYSHIPMTNTFMHVLGFATTLSFSALVSFKLALTNKEREGISSLLFHKQTKV